VIGGILEAAEVPGFLDNHHRLSEDVAEDDEAATFFAAWAGVFSEKVLAERPERRRTQMAYWLRDHRNQVRGGFQLVRVGEGRPKRWTVRRMEP
jgi:hypothetical protein